MDALAGLTLAQIAEKVAAYDRYTKTHNICVKRWQAQNAEHLTNYRREYYRAYMSKKRALAKAAATGNVTPEIVVL